MTAFNFDPVIHPLPRLQICAALVAEDAIPGHNEVKFAKLKNRVQLSDSALSKNLSTLEAADYIVRHREYGRTRAHDVVWIALTKAGYEAFRSHVQALRLLASGEGEIEVLD